MRLVGRDEHVARQMDTVIEQGFLRSIDMDGWLPKLLAYLSVYGAVMLATYVLIPFAGRRWIASIVLHSYERFCSDTRDKMKDHLHRGRKMLIPAGQAAIVGHLIEPYLEKLGDWMMNKANEHGHDRVVEACTDVCVKQLLRWRLTIAVATAQIVTGLIAIGFLMKGAI